MSNKVDLSVDFCGVRFPNPFILASSPVCSNYEMCAKAFKEGWGGVSYKTVGSGEINECSPRFDNLQFDGKSFVGFKNMEQISDKPLETNLEYISKLKRDFPENVLCVSIMGKDEDDWAFLAKSVEDAGADMLELNFSCPQMTEKGMGSDVGADISLITNFTKAVAKVAKTPIMAKMTPNITHMELPARAAKEAGASAISAINTIKCITGIDLDKLTALPVVDGRSSISGYSGAAAKPIGLRFVTQLAMDKELQIPISGIGGIYTWQDAAQYILVGASTLQVCTAVMQFGYRIVKDMKEGLADYMEEKGYRSIQEMVGKALPNIVPPEELDRTFKMIPYINEEKCIGCGRCVISCYDGAHQAIKWDADERRPIIDSDKCVGCHLCVNVCPALAIFPDGEVIRDQGYKGVLSHETKQVIHDS